MVLFTKPAEPGRVKTRLVGRLSAEQAAQLHRAFLGDLSARLGRSGWRWWSAWDLRDGESPPLDLLGGTCARWLRQRGDDLGERLHDALRQAAASGFDPVAAVGSDHPTFDARRLDECVGAMSRGADVVLGPAADGGYYLIACRARALGSELFEGIAWSTDRVLTETLERCAAAGLRVELLETGHDVDRPSDLERLARELAERPGLCPRTEKLLASWDLT